MAKAYKTSETGKLKLKGVPLAVRSSKRKDIVIVGAVKRHKNKTGRRP